MERRVTIYDVARHAGVSPATVSNAINAPQRVRPATLRRVLASIDELKFEPKAEAVARARRGTGRIGVVAPFATYPSFTQRLRGVLERLRDQPFETVLYDQESVAVRHDHLSTLPLSRRLDGLIVMSLPLDEGVTRRLLDRDLATVLVEFSRSTFDGIEIDDAHGGQLAAEYLIGRGHRRLAFIGERQLTHFVIAQGDRRLEGFRAGIAAAGLELPDERVSVGPFGVEEAREQAHRLLGGHDRPTAIFAHSDIQAIGVLAAARDLGLSVPGDLAVMGFDDLDVAGYVGLTTVHQPLVESGRIAVDLLLERLADPGRPARRVSLELSVIARETA